MRLLKHSKRPRIPFSNAFHVCKLHSVERNLPPNTGQKYSLIIATVVKN